MNHFGEFEGIGGFSLAARWMGWKTKGWSEIDPFCQQILQKNFPEAVGFGDIKKLNYATYKSILRNRGDRDRRIDIITGGFPCQPYSIAGQRKGNEDDRALWPEMFRTIREFKPAVVVGENVAGIISMDSGRVLSGIISDLESEGYTVEIFVIPACAVGAPHRRDRVWIIASNPKMSKRKQPRDSWEWRHGSSNQNSLAPNSYPKRRQRQQQKSLQRKIKEFPFREENGTGNINFNAYSDLQRCEQPHPAPISNKSKFSPSNDPSKIWSEHWLQVATRLCRVDDGIPSRMDGATPPYRQTSKIKRLKALGNAIVPQVAYQIFKAIQKEFDKV